MQIVVAAIGRMKHGPERELAARYLARAEAAGRALGLTGFSVAESPESRAQDASSRKREEAAALTRLSPSGARRIVLDERGKMLASAAFAEKIAAWRDDGAPALTLAIGGPDGHDPAFRDNADLVLSFSPMTWPHQLVRIMAAEQLYRATTILSGHPYHRGE